MFPILQLPDTPAISVSLKFETKWEIACSVKTVSASIVTIISPTAFSTPKLSAEDLPPFSFFINLTFD